MRLLQNLTYGVLGGGGGVVEPPTDVLVDGNVSGGTADSINPVVTWTPSPNDTVPGDGAYTYSVSVSLNGSPIALDNATGIGGDVASYTIDPTTLGYLALSDTAYEVVVTATRTSDSQSASSETVSALVDPRSIEGLTQWLATRDLSTLYQDAAMTTPAASDSDPVGARQDRSGNGYHETQATASAKPTLRLNQQNGLPMLSFDGGDSLSNASVPLTQPFTIITVHKLNQGALDSDDYLFDTPSGNRVFGLTGSSVDRYTFGTTGTGSAAYNTANNSATLPTALLELIFNGASSSAIKNGSSIGTGSVGTPNGTGLRTGNNQAANQGLDGFHAERLVFGGLLTANETTALRNYLNDIWDVF